MIIDMPPRKDVMKNAPRQLSPEARARILRGVYVPKPEFGFSLPTPEEVLAEVLADPEF